MSSWIVYKAHLRGACKGEPFETDLYASSEWATTRRPRKSREVSQRAHAPLILTATVTLVVQ